MNTDTYIKPGEVLGPKRYWQLFHVLFDGGPSGDPRPEVTGTSLAIGRWEGRPVLALRWNGNEQNPIGNPQSRGIPTWFVLPEHDALQILKSPLYNFSDSKIQFAQDFLELRRVYFLTRCPTPSCSNFGNLTLATYDSAKLADTIADLEADNLKFYCIYCDQQWHPTPDEKVRLHRDLEEGLRQYCKRGKG